tara:strand:+ start:1898 stop:2605 length:708 start_codon:yes stop_codon:yes gene_type:complete
MSKCLIISRYKEDLSWLKYHNAFKIYIYNKGPKIKDKQFKNIINLKNVGRESHTWLHHIVNNYNKLDDINIFLQGRIDDLNCMTYKNPNDYLKKINKYGFSASRYGLLGPFHWDWNVNIHKDSRYKEQWQNNEISRSKIGFRNFSKQLFPEIPLFVATSYSGCFAVKREIIRQHNISFYEKLLEILCKNKNPIEGHYLERLWCYMFTKNEPFVESIFNVIITKFERSKFKKIFKS